MSNQGQHHFQGASPLPPRGAKQLRRFHGDVPPVVKRKTPPMSKDISYAQVLAHTPESDPYYIGDAYDSPLMLRKPWETDQYVCSTFITYRRNTRCAAITPDEG